ncbi:hypothetical protein [Demequina phytophila]|uniref:hypothetical protein n=1 Tax=Demequina phytophila TaxID=1638981 RepID=UPI000782FB44|nr:hypothetical protein [Demequina phytophila]
MSTALTAALAREEQRGIAASRVELAALEERSLARLRRGRTVTRALVAGGSAAVVGVVAVGLAWGTDPSTTAAPATTPSPSVSPAIDESWVPTGGNVSAEALIASSTPRVLGQDLEKPRQAALLCEMDPAINPWRDAYATESTLTETKECEAVWVGDEPLLTDDSVYAMLHVGADATGGRMLLDWVMYSPMETDLTIDTAAIAATFATAPDTVSPPGFRTRGSYVGESLWVSPTQRLAVLGNASDPRSLADGATALGSAEVDTQPQGSVLHSDEVWAIAHGDVDPEVVLQVRVPPDGAAGGQELILEVPVNVEVDQIGVTAENLLTGWEPRRREDDRDPSRQAASLCEVPESAEAPRMFITMDWVMPFETLECDPIWLDERLLGAPRYSIEYSSEQNGGPGSLYMDWQLDLNLGSALQVAQSTLLVETAPSTAGSEADMTRVETLGFTTSAWTAAGTRLLPVASMLDGIFVGHLQGDNGVWGGAYVDPYTLGDNAELTPKEIRRAIVKGAPSTALVAVPFARDSSRVLVLEAPLGKPEIRKSTFETEG